MRSLFTVLLAMAVLTVIVLDGVAMFVAYQSSEDVAEAAAQQAVLEYHSTRGNVRAAEAAAHALAKAKRTELVSIEFHADQVKWFRAVAASAPETYVLKHIPVVKENLVQSSAAVVQF